MYLHQNILDIVLLQTRVKYKKTSKLASKYTYRIMKMNKNLVDEWWVKCMNTIRKIRYQWKYYKIEPDFIMIQTRWGYLTGPLVGNQKLLEYLSDDPKNFRLFNILISSNIKPTIKCMNNAAHSGNIVVFQILLKEGLKPTRDTLRIASFNEDITIFELCLKHKVKLTIDLLNKAVEYDNKEIIQICLKYIRPGKNTIKLARIAGNRHMLRQQK